MNECLDLVGLTLDDALERCEKLGLAVDILVTRPVQGISGERLRVVRYRYISGKMVLTVVFEDIRKGGSEGWPTR
ncbi:MAG: hypothetical protein A4E52_00236 [Pelotomaculum sp. PtaB.Bin013]|uniref:PASTA domain-containing protein n=1 Tax=Pelotomaculum isophthalicicum JI TaxID=947010 RepID=A0A9X4JVF0_9FIRM|nr:hypothetical protein [Pelotomaculum isophthalicicum]MDF9407272.1 hypothetical protein [Pelotomaculum isophthalicicum JI]OPX91964.1 MAG: hypothetical protein A4E52_00236 [Pelotomaculum sp. PtaB.Bin013]